MDRRPKSYHERCRSLRRAGTVLAAWVVVLGSALPSRAAAPPEPAPTVAPATTDPSDLLGAPEYGPLRAAWRETQADIARQAWAEASGRLQHLLSLRANLGLSDLFPLSSALLHATRQATEAGAPDAARDLVAAAVALSPHLAGARFEEARVAFDAESSDLASQIRSVAGALEALTDDVPGGSIFVGNLASAATWVLLAALALLAIAAVARHGTLVASDLALLLPTGSTHLQALVLLAPLLLVPLLAGYGLILTFFLWLVATGPYLATSERIGALVLIGCAALLPWISEATLMALRLPSTPAALLHQCNTSLCSEADRASLRRLAEDPEYTHDANLTLGLLAKRAAAASGSSDYGRARALLDRALADHPSAEALSALGNVSFLAARVDCPDVRRGDEAAATRYRRQLRDALEYWRQAIELAPERVAPRYNSSVILTLLDAKKDAASMLAAATQLDSEGVNRWINDIAPDDSGAACPLDGRGNRRLMDETLTASSLRSAALAAGGPTDGLVMPLARVLTGPFALQLLADIAKGAAAALLLLWVLARLLPTSRRCRICHVPAAPTARIDLGDGVLCRTCIVADLHRQATDAREMRFREARIARSEAWTARIPRLITWVMPGFGHMLRGATFRGLILWTIVFGCLMVAFDLHTVAHDIRQPVDTGMGRTLIFGAFAGIGWLVAVIGAHTAGPPS